MSTAYNLLKALHVATVVLSGTLFFVRGVWVLTGSARSNQRWTRIVPHVVDSVLLLSAIALMVIIRQYPFVHAWLTIKVIAVLIYIGLGMIAIRHGKRNHTRIVAWILALLIFAYIVVAALRHNPWPI